MHDITLPPAPLPPSPHMLSPASTSHHQPQCTANLIMASPVAPTMHLHPTQYMEMYQRSISDPDGFWGEIAEEFHWEKKVGALAGPLGVGGEGGEEGSEESLRCGVHGM